MNIELLKKHIDSFLRKTKEDEAKFAKDYQERLELAAYYREFTKDRIMSMVEDDVFEYISQLWAMLIWGNKHYIVEKILDDNSLDRFRIELAELVWGDNDIAERWQRFRKEIKGMGPATVSEILCKSHPDDYIIWNRRAYVGLSYLQVQKLPRYDYQLTGSVYKHLCEICKGIANELRQAGVKDTSLLAVDYFIWDELQVEDNLSKIYTKKEPESTTVEEGTVTAEELEFVHDDIRDKLRDIGQWLGFTAKIEQKVSDGSKVDTIWEATIGNMGRVIYVFEVQTKGSVDSLMMNLLKSLNNPAVQGIVAVSDKKQIDTIKRHANDVRDLREKLKYWDYEEVSRVHESLEYVNSSINSLGLVPQGF
jgi:hypothetical protein